MERRRPQLLTAIGMEEQSIQLVVNSSCFQMSTIVFVFVLSSVHFLMFVVVAACV